MSNQSNKILVGIAILVLAVALVADQGSATQEKRFSADAVVEAAQTQIEKMQQKIEAEIQRLQARLDKQLAKLEKHRAELLDDKAEQLAAEHARLAEELERAVADQERHAEELALAAEEMAQRAVEHASEFFVDVEEESGWLGVTISEVSAEKAKELKLSPERGVLVTAVDAESPAAKAGLKAGDVITEFNGQRVEGTVQFRRYVRETPAGRSAQLTIWRDARAQNLSVQLGSRGERDREHFRILTSPKFDFKWESPDLFTFRGGLPGLRAPVLGVQVEDLSGQLAAYFGAPDGEGILVKEVKAGSPAEKAGLKAGDIITKIDGTRVKTTSDLREQMREKREQKTVAVTVIRRGAELSVNVEIEQPKPPERRRIARRAGLPRSQLILDPGIGFGKSFQQNFELLARLPELARLGYPLLVGTSRKTFLGATLARLPGKILPPGQRIWGTAATVTAAILGGAHIVRVHDVAEMAQVARVTDALLRARSDCRHLVPDFRFQNLS